MKKYMAIAGLVLVTVIWGGGFVASDMALDSLSPFQIMTIRFLLASVLMGGISIRNLKGIKKEIIDEALSDIDENEKVENAFNLAKKAVKGKPLDQKQLIKVNRHLLSRGFDFETVNVVLNRLKTEDGFSDDTEE